jgi:hypothetical protein
MTVGGDAQLAKKGKSGSQKFMRKPETIRVPSIPGFQISLQAVFSSYP